MNSSALIAAPFLACSAPILGPYHADQPPATARELIFGYADLVPHPAAPWSLGDGYARAGSADGGNDAGVRTLTKTELPGRTEIVSLAAQVYLGNASGGAAAIAVGIDALSISPITGALVVDPLANLFTDVETNAWQTLSQALTTPHHVDWNIYKYRVAVTLSATGTVDNVRFLSATVTWR